MTHVLVSFCNVRVPRAPKLALLDLSASELKVLAVPEELEFSRGITGLALSDDYVFAAANPSSLFVFERRSLKLRSRYTFERGRDVHSLWAEGDRLWAVSTGTDEVLELRLQEGQVCSETAAWRPEGDGPREDVHHLNGLRRHEGRLIVSGFGRKATELWVSATQGFVQDIERDQTIVSSLDQPHSFEVLDDNLLLCESRKMTVRSADGGMSRRLTGYTRGLCVVDGSLLVGTSKGRLVSKSADVVNNPSDPGEPAGSCSITRLSAKTWDVEEVIDATSLGREVYDLLPVEGIEDWPILTDADWRETTLRELWEAMDRSGAQAKSAKLAQVKQGTLLAEANRGHELERAKAEERAAAREQDLESRVREIRRLEQEVARLAARVNAREEQLELAVRRGVESRKGGVAGIPRSLRGGYKLVSWLVRPTPTHRRFLKDYLSLRRSEDFEPDFYLAAYPDVQRAGWDPLMHYIEHGWRGGSDPSARFSTSAYLAARPDVAKADVNPLLHYVKHGKAAGQPITPASSRVVRAPGTPKDLPRSARGFRSRTPEGVPTSTESSSGPSSQRPKISVLCWDMGHNPLGRAHLLADALSRSFEVEIVGAQFPRFGDRIWAPLRDSGISMRTFRGTEFPEHFDRMEGMARQVDGDIILAAKPRLPSYELAILAKEAINRPLILDIDDREVSFFSQSTGMTLSQVNEERDEPDYVLPFGRLWTQYCDTMVGSADATLVSNQALGGLYGGTVISHGRNESLFDPNLYDRDALRARFGFDRNDRVILFVGTPRAHKGVLELVDALQALPDRRIKLCIIGSVTDPEMKRRLDLLGNERVVLVGDRPVSELPQNMMVGDLVCLLQDPQSEIARYQMPAKFTDALAMGVPMLGTRVAPLAAAISQGLIEPADADALADQIADNFERLEQRRAQALENRQHFIREYSYAAIDRQLRELIKDLSHRPVPFAADFGELLDYHRSRFRTTPTRAVPRVLARQSAAREIGAPSQALQANGNGRAGRPARSRRATRDELIDIVFFWKQNDSGIYGRRSDMMVKHLAESDRVGQIVHFDAPMDEAKLRLHQTRSADPTDHGALIVKNTLRRARAGRRRGKVKGHVFVYARANGEKKERASDLKGLGPLPFREEYPDFVGRVLDSYGIGARPTVFWDCPIDYGFPQLSRLLRPEVVVADVIDDGREFLAPNSAERVRATQNYRDVLALSDLVITNCRPVQESMGEYAQAIHLVPNAAESLRKPPRLRPRELRSLGSPLVGYVGNLSSRIDIDLLEHVARARPRWQLVLLGSTHVSRAVLRLREYPNVHFLGVKPYPGVRRYVAAFDVAMVPHLDDPMTQSMNPLKLFVYASLGVPIVSTAVSNIDELRPLVRSASTPEAFVEAVEEALRAGRGLTAEGRSLLAEHSWSRRVEHVLDLLDEVLAGKVPV